MVLTIPRNPVPSMGSHVSSPGNHAACFDGFIYLCGLMRYVAEWSRPFPTFTQCVLSFRNVNWWFTQRDLSFRNVNWWFTNVIYRFAQCKLVVYQRDLSFNQCILAFHKYIAGLL